MDQQQLSSMDPKLREAYDRIMGNTPAQTDQPITPAPQQSPIPPSQATQNQTVSQPSDRNIRAQNESSIQNSPSIQSRTDAMPPTAPPPPPNPQPQPPPSPQPFIDPVVADNQMHAYVAAEVAGVKQSLKIIQIMYIIGGLVFFAVYALFWMKFFNIPSPF